MVKINSISYHILRETNTVQWVVEYYKICSKNITFNINLTYSSKYSTDMKKAKKIYSVIQNRTSSSFKVK